MKKVLWQKLLIKTFIWFMGEIILNLIGIDDLVDYSEFLFENKASSSPGIIVSNIALVS